MRSRRAGLQQKPRTRRKIRNKQKQIFISNFVADLESSTARYPEPVMVLFDEQLMYSYKAVDCQGANPSMSRRCNINVVAIPTSHSHYVVDIASHFQRPFLTPWDSSEDKVQLNAWIASATGEFTHLIYISFAFALL